MEIQISRARSLYARNTFDRAEFGAQSVGQLTRVLFKERHRVHHLCNLESDGASQISQFGLGRAFDVDIRRVEFEIEESFDCVPQSFLNGSLKFKQHNLISKALMISRSAHRINTKQRIFTTSL